MAGNPGPRPGGTAGRRIRNTFAPNCRNKDFDAGGLFSLCKWGFPFEKLPEEAREMVIEYGREYVKRCTKAGDKVKFPPLPTGLDITI